MKKRCVVCKKKKNITAFYKNAGNSDGCSNKCKQCAREYAINKRGRKENKRGGKMSTKLYDPRDNTEKESNNPMLVLNAVMERLVSKIPSYQLEIDYYRDVIRMANYCDEEVE